MNVDASQHSCAHRLDRHWAIDPSRMIVDQHPLELNDILIFELGFGELTDAGIHSVDGLPSGQFCIQHLADSCDALCCLRAQLNDLVLPSHTLYILDGKACASDGVDHLRCGWDRNERTPR